MVKPSDKKKAINYLKEKYNAGVGRLCKICCFSRSSYYYESKLDDTEVEEKLLEMATKHPTRGFDNYYAEYVSKAINGLEVGCYGSIESSD